MSLFCKKKWALIGQKQKVFLRCGCEGLHYRRPGLIPQSAIRTIKSADGLDCLRVYLYNKIIFSLLGRRNTFFEEGWDEKI